MQALRSETEAARALLGSMADILGDDDELKESTVEGETNLYEAINAALGRIVELNGHIESLEAMASSLKERSSRFDRQSALIRSAIQMAMEIGEVRKLESPLATLSLRAVPPAVQIIAEADIPAKFWKPVDPKLDKKALLAALKDGERVPGATLDNGGQTLSIRSK